MGHTEAPTCHMWCRSGATTKGSHDRLRITTRRSSASGLTRCRSPLTCWPRKKQRAIAAFLRAAPRAREPIALARRRRRTVTEGAPGCGPSGTSGGARKASRGARSGQGPCRRATPHRDKDQPTDTDKPADQATDSQPSSAKSLAEKLDEAREAVATPPDREPDPDLAAALKSQSIDHLEQHADRRGLLR